MQHDSELPGLGIPIIAKTEANGAAHAQDIIISPFMMSMAGITSPTGGPVFSWSSPPRVNGRHDLHNPKSMKTRTNGSAHDTSTVTSRRTSSTTQHQSGVSLWPPGPPGLPSASRNYPQTSDDLNNGARNNGARTNTTQQPPGFVNGHTESTATGSRPASRQTSLRPNTDDSGWHNPEPSFPMKTSAGRSGGKWPTAAEVRYDPANHIDPDEENDSSIVSNEVDLEGNFTMRRKKRRQSAELGLADWEGNWAPPPADWDERYRFSEKEPIVKVVRWLEDFKQSKYQIALFNVPQRLLMEHEHGICPPEWIPDIIEEEDPDMWLQEQMMSMELEDQDDRGPPFWKMFLGPNDERLRKYDVPDPRLDPSDNDISKSMGQCSAMAMKDNDLRNQKQRNKQKRLKEERREYQREQMWGPTPQHEHSPRVNAYLRPVEARDLQQVQELYGYWIENTVYCPERSALDLATVKDRWEDIMSVDLPFIVAADRSSRGNRRQGRRSGGAASEPIVGFAFADDFMSPNGMYRYAAEIECFVHPDYLRRNVGRTLMDKMMCALDPHYASNGGYDFIGDDLRYSNGGKRIVDTVIVNVPHPSNDKSKLAWLSAWIEQYDFKKAADYPEIGRKLGTK